MASDVFGKLFDQTIPALRLFAHRRQNDVIQIARQLAGKPAGQFGRLARLWRVATLGFSGSVLQIVRLISASELPL
jgi:hypothetical protein